MQETCRPVYGRYPEVAPTGCSRATLVPPGETDWLCGDAASKRLPEVPPAVTAVLPACGKVAKTLQVPFAVPADAPAGVTAAPATPGADAARPTGAVAPGYRVRIAGIVERAVSPMTCRRPSNCTRAGRQYPILGADQWRQLVENLAALDAELDRTFVPEVEAAAGPSPEWYRPEA